MSFIKFGHGEFFPIVEQFSISLTCSIFRYMKSSLCSLDVVM